MCLTQYGVDFQKYDASNKKHFTDGRKSHLNNYYKTEVTLRLS